MIYLLLDTGATSSLVTKSKADELNLQIHSTTHKAIQIDGETNLKVLGKFIQLSPGEHLNSPFQQCGCN